MNGRIYISALPWGGKSSHISFPFIFIVRGNTGERMTSQKLEIPDAEACPWMIEFSQDYMDGFHVKKRGLDATPMVMKKYHIGSNEVMAFSNYQKRHSAISVFHFHPDFPFEQRREYMEMHSEGYEVVLEAVAESKTERRKQQAVWATRLRRAGRTFAVSAHAILLFVIAHNPGAR